MQLVLLSGGSGKMLWPLSNDARSKQFLHPFESPSGEMESMVQRVVRQIRRILPQAEITFASTLTQRDGIINRIGDNVNIVIDPQRRDTFPSIALATDFLSKEKGFADDAVVVVMPCDVFTENGYFDAIARMASAAQSQEAELVLMGVRPTCPSDKYGYIIPSGEKSGALSSGVSRFIEKPDLNHAEKLLEEGAYWNGGVFAFRLGYIMNIVSRYSQLPKISFDYEVVEKAESVSFIPYEGKWKDLGTWHVLCEELPSDHIGNVHMGKDKCNAQVINELELPLFCEGLQDVVVAASPDGILVCAKEHSESIKDYVEQMHARPMYEERRWGTYRVLDSATYPYGAKPLTKSLTIKAGKSISYQIHHHRSEVWTIVDGLGEFVLDGQRMTVQ